MCRWYEIEFFFWEVSGNVISNKLDVEVTQQSNIGKRQIKEGLVNY